MKRDKIPLSDKLIKYLQSEQGKWLKKVNIFVIADTWGYSPETVGRCLRTLAEELKISVDYYDGTHSKNLAKYSYKPVLKERTIKEAIINRETNTVSFIDKIIYE